MRVQEIMSAPVQTIDGDEPAAVAWERLRLQRIRHLVVVGRDGKVKGIVSPADLGGPRGESLRRGRSVADLMRERVVAIQRDATVREAANLMRGHLVDCLPVFHGDRLKGIITALDLLELIGRGAERPVATARRRILKDRGVRPKTVASAAPGARTRA